jgi:hypothetical protein
MGLFGKATLFTAFFPTYEKKFTNTIAEHCVPVYNEYLRDGRGLGNAYTYPVFNCIMENTTEGTKAAMGATTVLLGLTPVVLSSLGNSTAEMSVLSLRRPFLTLCLAIGSPLLLSTRPFQYSDPIETLRVRRIKSRLLPHKPPNWLPGLISGLEYSLAFAAGANAVHVAYSIGLRAVGLVLSPNFRYGVLIWIFIGVGIHALAALGISGRAKFSSATDGAGIVGRPSFTTSIWHELTPCVYHQSSILEWKDETLLHRAIQLFVSLGITIHLVFGTAILSSVYLIAVSDAVVIIGRLGASTLICRILLMFELSGIRQSLREIYTEGSGSDLLLRKCTGQPPAYTIVRTDETAQQSDDVGFNRQNTVT